MQPQNEDQVRSMRELLQSRKDVSAKRGAFFFLCFGSNSTNVWGERKLIGTLGSNDATATRTSLKKVCLRSFSLDSDYSYPITLSNVGEPS